MHPGAEATIRAFFGCLGRGDWRAASAWVTDPVDVFGFLTARERFAAGVDRSIGHEVTTLAEVPTRFFVGDEPGRLLGGPVDDDAQVCFATVSVAGAPTTYGLVLRPDAGGPKVTRLFDPTAFKHFAASLDAARRGVEQVPWP